MDRAEKIGLGTAVAGHVLLFALLSARFFSTPVPTPVQQTPLEVSLVKDVALQAAAPKAVEPPAPSIAPDQGAPEDAAPPEPAEAPPEPEPKPAPPVEKPTPPKPKAKPAPPVEKPAPPKPKPAPRKPVEKPEPAPKPVAVKKPAPEKKAKPEPVAKPEKAAKTSAKTSAKTAPAKTASKASTAAAASAHTKPASEKGTGHDTAAKTHRPRGSLLGDDFLKGLTDKPSKSASPAPVAAKIGAQEIANIGQAISRQVQPCANQQHTPGPGAERILVVLNLRLNRDGSLAARPKVVGHSGVDGENERYVARVDDLAIATYVGCSPLHGLPEALYDVQNGWSNFTLRYKLPG